MTAIAETAGVQRSGLWTWVGLLVALGGPCLAVAAKHNGWLGADKIDGSVLSWMVMWGAALLAMLILVAFERQPLSAIGFDRFGGRSLFFGLVLGVIVVMLFPIAAQILKAANVPNPANNAAQLMALPLWVRIGTWLTAGVTEEILFRGYAISRLKAASGSTVFAALIPFAVFVGLHLPAWGLGHLLFVSMAAAVFTLAFLWRGDLWTNIIGHLTVDAVPLLILPLIGTPPPS